MVSETPDSRVSAPLNSSALLVFGLILVDGLHFVFARLVAERVNLSPLTAVLYVLSLGAAEIALYTVVRGRFRFGTFRKHAAFFLSIGLLVAVSTTINYTAVHSIDPGPASLLAQTSILYGLGFGFFWLRERLNRVQLVGAAIAIVGVVVLSYEPGNYLRPGALLVVLAAGLYALHGAIVKRWGGEMDFAEFFVWRLISTSAFLFVGAAAQGVLAWPNAAGWPVLLLVASVDICVSRTLYYLALRRLRISIHTLILTLSPVVAILWSLALFGLRPTAQDLIGGAGVLVGVAIVTMRR